MSTIRSNPRRRSKTTTPVLRTGCVLWSIERRAALLAQPELGFDAKSRKPVELRISFDGERALAAELFDSATNRSFPIELVRPQVSFLDAEPYTHVEIADTSGSILSATIKSGEEACRLLYARTTLLSRLQIKGGRYPSPGFSRESH